MLVLRCLCGVCVYSSAVLSWLGGCVVGGVFVVLFVRVSARVYVRLRVWACGCGLVAGGLVSAWWVSPRARVLFCVFGWVGDVEGVAFLEELFGLVGGDDAAADGGPFFRVFAACAYGEELLGEPGRGYGLCGVLAVWVGVSECGVLCYGSDGVGAAVGFECECGGDVADARVAEVCVAGCGCFALAVACVFPV